MTAGLNESLTSSVMRTYRQFNAPLFYAWNINSVSVDGADLRVQGWALPLDGRRDNTEVYCNGVRGEVSWTGNAHVGALFPFWPDAEHSELDAVWRAAVSGDSPAGPLCFEVRSADGTSLDDRCRLYFEFDDLARVKVPDAELSHHIGGPDPSAFVLSGRTLATQFDAALREATGQGFADQAAVLDWGCGSARVLQSVHLHFGADGQALAGVDVDAAAITWCQDNVPGIDFAVCEINPPTGHRAGAFDVVYAFSVLTHLRAQDASAWVDEVLRLLRPGGTFMFTTLGVSSLAWLQPHGDPHVVGALAAEGIYDGAKNTDIDGVIADQAYYRNTWVTEDYVREVWGEGLDLLSYVPCLHHYQDLWVFRKPLDTTPRPRRVRARVHAGADPARHGGTCPICGPTTFHVAGDWLRDQYLCEGCSSVPRMRQLAKVLDETYPQWRDLEVLEASPAGPVSAQLAAQAAGYTTARHVADITDLPGASVDLVVTQDAFGHVLDPDAAWADIARVLRPGGAHVWTVPLYGTPTVVRAVPAPGGEPRLLMAPVHHGDPIVTESLVVHDWGFDVVERSDYVSGLRTERFAAESWHHGIRGAMIDVLVSRKPG